MRGRWDPQLKGVVCPEHGDSGQEMDRDLNDEDVYVCPKCGARARVEVRWV